MMRSNKHRIERLWILLCVVVLTGCGRSQRAPAPAPTPKQPTTAEQQRAKDALVTWLECEECTDGELEAVVGCGRMILPSLVRTLELGPAPAQTERLRLHLEKTYDQLVAYEKTHPEAKVGMSRSEYLRTYLDNYRTQYKVRAGIALGALGGPDAKKALKEAISQAERADLREALDRALRTARS